MKLWPEVAKNTTPVWTDLQNYFAWLIDVKKLTFYCNNLFGFGHFSISFQDFMDQKNGRSQKSCYYKKSVFSCPSIMLKNFWNRFTIVLYLYDFWPELEMAAITPKDIIFDWNLVGIEFTKCRIGILGLIVNLRVMGLT